MGAPAEGLRYVYVFSDADGVCLYVGCTGALGHRLTTHARERDWWSEVAHIEVTVHADHATGAAAEAATIRARQPRHNRVFTEHFPERGGWGSRRRNLARKAGAA